MPVALLQKQPIGGLPTEGAICPDFHPEGCFQTLIFQTNPGLRGKDTSTLRLEKSASGFGVEWLGSRTNRVP